MSDSALVIPSAIESPLDPPSTFTPFEWSADTTDRSVLAAELDRLQAKIADLRKRFPVAHDDLLPPRL